MTFSSLPRYSIVFAIIAVGGGAGIRWDLFRIVFCVCLLSVLFQGTLSETGLVVLIRRANGSTAIPHGNTTLRNGDALVIRNIS